MREQKTTLTRSLVPRTARGAQAYSDGERERREGPGHGVQVPGGGARRGLQGQAGQRRGHVCVGGGAVRSP